MPQNIVIDQQVEAPIMMRPERSTPINQKPEEELLSDGFVILHAYPSSQMETKWLQCLSNTVAPAHYASPAFFLEPYFAEKKPFAVLAVQDGKVTGALTGLHDQETVISGLETRVHIAVAQDEDPQQVLRSILRGVERETKGAKLVQIYSWRELQLTPFSEVGYRRRELTGNPILDLSLGSEALLKKCGKSQRHNIRLAIKNDVEIVEATTKDEFEAFYTLYDQWCCAKQVYRYSKDVEWEAFETTRNNRRYFLARHQGKVIAGSVVRFYPGGLVECSRNSSLPEFLNLKPNDLLIAHTIEWACKNGFTRLSFGAHHKFLRGFGGQITPIDRYRVDRTLLRRYDLQDMVKDRSRAAFYGLPKPYQEKIRKVLRREKPAGW